MFPVALTERLDTLIDDLILDGGVETASVASILLAAKDSVKSRSVLRLSCQVRTVYNEMETARPFDDARRVVPADPCATLGTPFQTV